MSSATSSLPKRRTKGFEVIRWIEANCVFTNGEWIGHPARLFAWQKRLILELFEVGPDDLRRFRWAYISVAKKNGKTELMAFLALYLLIGDGEPSPLVVCAAASDDQADLVFGAASKCCELSPTLGPITDRYEKEILVPSIPGAKLRRVAAIAGTNDGQNISAVIIDELHEWVGEKGRNVWNVLTNGTGARKQPLILQITTAGWDKETICGEQYDHAIAVQQGAVDDPTYYVHIVEAPPGLDYRTEAYWRAANPTFGIIQQPAFYADQARRKRENDFRRYFGNEWTANAESWLPPGAWSALQVGLPDPDRWLHGFDKGKPVGVGLDVALTHDSSALLVLQEATIDGLPRIAVRARFWINPYPPGSHQHDDWQLDVTALMDQLRRLRELFPVPGGELDGRAVPGPAYGYDPWGFRAEADTLAGEGLLMIEIPQTDTRMAPATRDLYDAIIDHEIAHDGHPILSTHLANAVGVPRGENGWRLRKPTRTSPRKIDGAVALVMGLHVLRRRPIVEPSIYDSRGIRTIGGSRLAPTPPPASPAVGAP